MKLLNKIKLKSRLTCLVKHKDKRLKPIKAFTLIELLVVIAIIGILAGVVVVNVGNASAKARDAKRVSDLKALNTAIQMYYDDHGSYPSTTTQPSLSSCGWVSNTLDNYWACYAEDFIPGLQNSTYISTLPKDPKPRIGWLDNTKFDGGYLYYSNGADYKIMVHTPENCDYEKNKVIADPPRSPGGVYASVDTTTCWAWSYYSDGFLLTPYNKLIKDY